MNRAGHGQVVDLSDPLVRAAREAALDHVLRLLMAQPWSDCLVLRGSMLMRAWFGEAARAPADLDFVALPDLSVAVDPLDPHPFVTGFDVAQQWPEAADGACRYEIWKDGEGEYDTCGVQAIVPPEGLGPSPKGVDTHWYQLCGKREYS